MLLAVPSWFGKIPLYICLSLLNVVAWWMTAQFANAMTGSGRTPGPWLFALPGFVTVTFVFDMFDLGQPNLVLLALMLYGFWLLRDHRNWMAGSMFALATAIKVFPVAVLPYLVWRRQWAAAASMLVFIGVFLFVVPAPFRGFERNAHELKTWYQGMVGTSSEKGFGQRDEQNWSWVNQSIIAMTHRLTRPINYNQEDPAKPVRTMNVVNLDFKTANLLVAAISLLIGLGYVAVMPRASRRTERSDAEEIGILFCLMTAATPLARQYYFHVAVLSDDGLDPSRRLRSACACQDRHMAVARGGRPIDVAVAAAIPQRLAGLWQQSRRHRSAGGGPGLAHPPSAAGGRGPCFASGGRAS